jgi:glutathione S-transferase
MRTGTASAVSGTLSPGDNAKLGALQNLLKCEGRTSVNFPPPPTQGRTYVWTKPSGEIPAERLPVQRPSSSSRRSTSRISARRLLLSLINLQSRSSAPHYHDDTLVAVEAMAKARGHWNLTMNPTITAFERSPDGGKGLARDTRVRWALEEVGQPYDIRPVSFKAMKEPRHRALHPFGQIPTYEEGELTLFESGAIVFHIAQRHQGLLPEDSNARARAITWMFAALNTVEPPILDLSTAKIVEGDKPWAQERLPLVMDRIRVRLGQLSTRLGKADWLDGAFSAGDLLMVSVLLRLRMSGILDEYPNVAAYVFRGESRAAYERAYEEQLAFNTR